MKIYSKKFNSKAKLLLCHLLLAVFTSGCGYTHLVENTDQSDFQKREKIINNYQPEGDSEYLPGYYYSFNFNDFESRDVSPDWILGNLEHFGITIQDAWYTPSTSPYRDGNFITGTVYPPGMIVRLNPDNHYILYHHFVKCIPFKLSKLNSISEHYYSSQQD